MSWLEREIEAQEDAVFDYDTALECEHCGGKIVSMLTYLNLPDYYDDLCDGCGEAYYDAETEEQDCVMNKGFRQFKVVETYYVDISQAELDT